MTGDRVLIPLAEAAHRLGVRGATLRQQIANGRLRGREYGRDWFIHPDELERYRCENSGRVGRKPKVNV